MASARKPGRQHPLRLVLLRRDVAHDVFGQAALRAGPGDVGVGPAEAVAAERIDLLVLSKNALRCGGHQVVLPDRDGVVAVTDVLGGSGTYVVHTPSP